MARTVTRFYTVVLLYPDFLASQFGDSYLAHVRAADSATAQLRAQEKAWKPFRAEHGDPVDKSVDLDAFAVLATFRGRHADLTHAESRFRVGRAAACTLADFLAANSDDAEVCEWARGAKPGDTWNGMHSETVRCIQ